MPNDLMSIDVDFLVEQVATAVETATAPLLARIAQLERRAPTEGPVGPPGAKGDTGASGGQGEQGPPGAPGKDADIALLLAMKAEIATMQGEWIAFKAWQSDALTKAAAGQPIVQGLSPESVRTFIAAEVAAAIKAIELPVPEPGPMGPAGPAGERGQDGAVGPQGPPGAQGERGADGARGPAGERGQDGAVGAMGPAGQDGKAGVGMTDAFVDRAGHLVLTLSDGGTKDVGLVMGQNVDPSEVVRIIREEVAKFPTPQDGINGKDGLGFDDMDVIFDPEHGYQIRFTRGDLVKTFPLAVPWHAGVYDAGKLYPKGAGVTDHGAIWIAQEPTRSRPPKLNEPRGRNCAWLLSVKPGRDGRDK